MSPNADRAALYLRSSKDRSDVSIDAQRRELKALASSKSFHVAAEFADEVQAANDVSRAGFRALLSALRDPARGWSTLLVMDTSRLARNVYLAESFKHECRRRGVTVLYSKMPSVNPMMDLIVTQVVQAMDQLHSMMSREKGLAGMAENVRQGFRAGGRAPFGYRLEHIETGAIREGEPVTKSRLVASDNAPAIAAYLKARAAGANGQRVAGELGIRLSPSSLTGLEWNALTFAGHTVWNVHNARDENGSYTGGKKRRPREEWVIQRDTHQALITEAEAEAILARLGRGSTMRMRSADYLLSGILVTPTGARWHGNDGLYRAGRRNISAQRIERAILAKIAQDLASDAFVRALTAAARKAAQPDAMRAQLAVLQRRADELTRKIARYANLLPETTATRPLIEKMEELERERAQVQIEAQDLNNDLGATKTMAAIAESDVRAMLNQLAADLENFDRATLKDLVRGLVEKITLDPDSLTACLSYAIPVGAGVSVASPRAGAIIPTLKARRFIRLQKVRRQAA